MVPEKTISRWWGSVSGRENPRVTWWGMQLGTQEEMHKFKGGKKDAGPSNVL